MPLPGQEQRPDPRGRGSTDMQGTPSAPAGSQAPCSPGDVARGVRSPEVTLSWPRPVPVLPSDAPSHTTRPPSCPSFGSPSHFVAAPPAVCPLEAHVAGFAGHAARGSLAGHCGPHSCPGGCVQTKAYATGSFGAPAAKCICTQWGTNTHSRPLSPCFWGHSTLRRPDCRRRAHF